MENQKATIKENIQDVQESSEYVEEIYEAIRSREAFYLPKVEYMTKQPDLTEHMRTVLVDWLVEVAEEYKLLSETLYMSINYVDRFLSNFTIPKEKLQLLGVTCMLIASKFEEVFAPGAEEFAFITDHTYKKSEIFEMEGLVLSALSFNLLAPTPRAFHKRLFKASNASELTMRLTEYISELTLINYSCLQYKPSLIAAASFRISREIVENNTSWDANMEQYSGYKADDEKLNKCIADLREIHANAKKSQFKGVIDKYSLKRFSSVAYLEPRVQQSTMNGSP